MSWLDPVRTALDRAAVPVPMFFRDDDAGWADDRLVALLDQFAYARIPIDVAVIPAALQTGTALELRARARAGEVHLHQHGYRHVDHQLGGRKYEFGTARCRTAQAADVGSGRGLLLDAFGDLLEPVFTPPWNRCTSDTCAALAEIGLRVLSRDLTADRLKLFGLVEIPVTVDWFGHRKGVRWTPVQLAARLAADVVAGGPLGVMLHHAVIDDAELRAVGELLDLVANHDLARSTTISALAA